MDQISNEYKEAQRYKRKAEGALKLFSASIPTKAPSRLPELMHLARYMDKLWKTTSSTKVYGKMLKEQLPQSQVMKPPARSNLLWLYRAVHVAGAPGKDLFEVLGATSWEQLRSDDPTVVRREYRKRKELIDKGATREFKAFTHKPIG